MDGSTDNLQNLQMEEIMGEVLKQPTDREEPYHYKPLKHNDNPSNQSDHEQKFIDEYNNDNNDDNESEIDDDAQDPSKHKMMTIPTFATIPTTSNKSEIYLSSHI